MKLNWKHIRSRNYKGNDTLFFEVVVRREDERSLIECFRESDSPRMPRYERYNGDVRYEMLIPNVPANINGLMDLMKLISESSFQPLELNYEFALDRMCS